MTSGVTVSAGEGDGSAALGVLAAAEVGESAFPAGELGAQLGDAVLEGGGSVVVVDAGGDHAGELRGCRRDLVAELAVTVLGRMDELLAKVGEVHVRPPRRSGARGG